MRLSRLLLVAGVSALMAQGLACSEDTGSTSDNLGECKTPGLAPRRVFSDVKFTNLVGLVQPPGDGAPFYAIEHQGVVKRLEGEGSGATVALDISSKVNTNNWEPGLFAIAFHPKFAENGELYVTYTGFGGPSTFEWRLSRFVSKDGGKTFDPASEKQLILLQKPNADHNGGSLAFGPDGFLYVSVGDGGEQKDPNRNAQNTNVLFGKILRIDVDDRNSSAVQYGIPADNPFKNEGGRPEIFALGFRNPWGISFDRETGQLWAGDVGQNNLDEVNIVELGKNYGWNVFEANECHDPARCKNFKAVPPVVSLPHKNSPIAATSVTGGFVYRGRAIKRLQGAYVFADFTTGKLFASFPGEGGKRDNRIVGRVAGRISAFGEDSEGELYALDYNQGQVHKLIEGKCAGKPEVDPNARNYAFLAIDGIGTEQDAKDYYRGIGADDSLTLDRWTQENIGDGPTVSALYQNAFDLGFWREMTCSKTIARGKGGCRVRNWNNPTDAADPAKKEQNLGTVTMNISNEGVTRFYVFNNVGNLSTKAVLDDEGEKFVPALCTPCHGGQYSGGDAVDLGSIWREFEPTAFVKHPDISEEEAQKQWFELNQVMRQANEALRTQAEGGIPGIDQGRAAMIDYLDRMYVQTDPPVARSVHDPEHMPDTWKTGLSSQRRSGPRWSTPTAWAAIARAWCATSPTTPTSRIWAPSSTGNRRWRRSSSPTPTTPSGKSCRSCRKRSS